MSGYTTTDLTVAPLADEVIVNRNGSTARQRVADLSTQLAGDGPLAEQLDDLRVLASGEPRQLVPADMATTAAIALTGAQTIDGIATGAGKRVLVKDQADATQNGVWVTSAGAWTRATDLDAAAEFTHASIYVTAGTVNRGTTWMQVASVAAVGSSAVSWRKIKDEAGLQGEVADLAEVAETTIAVLRAAYIEDTVLYDPSGVGVYPIAIGADRVLLGLDTSGSLVADIGATLGAKYGLDGASYTGGDDIIPIIAAQNGAALCYFDKARGRLRGAFGALDRLETVARPDDGSIDTAFDLTMGQPVWWSGSRWVDAIGSLAVPALYHDFTVQPDGAIGTPVTGQTWTVYPANGSYTVLPVVNGGRLIAPDSGGSATATYWGVDFGAAPTSQYALISFSPGVSGSGAAIISCPNGIGVFPITDSSLHIVYTDTYVDVGFFSGGDRSGGGSTAGALTIVSKINYSTPIPRDSTTTAVVGYRLIGGNSVEVLLPDGSRQIVTSVPLVAAAGRYAIFEHFWQGSTKTRPAFHKVSVA